jgi:membrane associated rhomboid family serine protease
MSQPSDEIDVITAKEDKNKVIYSLIVSCFFVIILWIIKLIEEIPGTSFSNMGIYPGEISGLKGIIFSPFIHGDFSHLISNTSTLFVGMFAILYFYRTSAYKVLIIVWIATGLMVWFLGRPSYHIGASGIIYGLISFIFFSGVIRKDKRAVGLSLLMVFLYGGLVWGVLPVDEEISFESHLFGAVIGLICAVIFRKNDPPKKYEWEEEDEYEDEYPEEDDKIDPDDIKIDDDARPKYF